MQNTLSPRRHLGGLLAALAALATPLAATTVITAAPASAAGCYNYGCHGHDPNAYGCTVSSQKFAYLYSGQSLMATLTNKYSNACDANWAQAQLSQYAVNLGWNFQVQIWTWDSQTPSQYEVMCYDGPGSYNNTGWLDENCTHNPPYNDGWTNPTWTDMVDGTNTTDSSMTIYDQYGHLMGTLRANQ